MTSCPFEKIPQQEPGQIEEVADLTEKLQNKRYPKPERILRGVHPKSHGCVAANFEVNADIDQSLQVGLFSRPGAKYQAWVRFSNASATVGPDLVDSKNGSRGMALKVLDVAGDEAVLLDDGGARSQDFLMINTPAFAFVNLPDYLRLNQILLENNDDPSMFFAPLGTEVPGITEEDIERIKRSAAVVGGIQSKPVANPLGVQYFGAAPFLFGADRIMRFSAEPVGGAQPQVLPDDPSPNYLREALAAQMSETSDIVFDFKLQVRGSDEEGLGIEDATTVWDEEEFPFVNVATITVSAPQDVGTETVKEGCEQLVFTPWHSLESHRPLGRINRLRKQVYQTSADHRETP
ncbi:MAG: catalase family protein [Gammaproteobacteria bacterium]|nr:catalase family protein [Gammaproteobacteria bacterium]